MNLYFRERTLGRTGSPEHPNENSRYMPFKNVYIKQYYHMDCAFGTFQKARVVTNVISNVYEIDGFDNINAVDKSRIIDLFDNHKMWVSYLCPRPCLLKKTLSIQTPVKSRKSNLKSSSLPSINVMFTNADQLTPSKLAELKKGIEL